MMENKKILIDESAAKLDTVIENADVQVEDAQENIVSEIITKETSQVSEYEVIDIGIEEAFPYASNNDISNHAELNNRDADNAHPIKAISGLRDELDYIRSVKRVYSSENGLAEFYAWADGNPSWENRAGYFVKLIYDTETGVERVAICTDKDDVYGVVVQSSGFVGNQIGADHGDDPAYAMVGIVGALRVRTDGTAQIGDYVVPSAAGIATKSEHNCGYRVVSHGSYPSYPYVTIAVTPQNDKINKIYGMLMESDGSIGNISIRIDEMESKIDSANNNINVAIGNTEELRDLLEGSTVEIDRINQTINEANGSIQEAITNVNKAINDANDAVRNAQAAAQDAKSIVSDLAGMAELAENMEVIVDYQFVDAEGNTYVGAAGVVARGNENGVMLGDLATQVTDNGHDLASRIIQLDQKLGASIQDMVSHIDRYSVGELSLSYGLTIEQAESILQYDYIYVPTSTHSETIDGYTYKETINGNDTKDVVVPAKTVQFERGYAYTWDAKNVTWNKGAPVSTAVTYSDGVNVGDLWYCFQDVKGPDVDGVDGETLDGKWYLAETLYRWSVNFDVKDWIAVATVRTNYRDRIVSSVKQTAESINQTITALDGRVSQTVQEVDSVTTRVGTAEGNISTVTQRVDGIDITIANINGTLSATQQRVSDNEASITMINHGAFHVVQQSFVGAAPAAVGNKYTAPPTWNEATKQFEFNAALASGSGQYYFHSADKTKYVKVVSGGYEIYTIGNLATASYDSRITENSADIAELVKYTTDNNTNIAGIISTADKDRATVTALAQTVSNNKDTADKNHNSAMAAIQAETGEREAAITSVTTTMTQKDAETLKGANGYTDGKVSDTITKTEAAITQLSNNLGAEINLRAKYTEVDAKDAAMLEDANDYTDGKVTTINKTMADIKAQADANGASISAVVTDGKANGNLIINAINGTSNAYIDADNIVFGKGVGTNSGDNFYLKLTSSEATMRNGSLNIHKGNFSILLDPTNGIQMKNGNSDIFFFKPDGSAKIGSWNVAGDRLYSGSGANYMALSAADTSYYVWAGSETAASAPFSVTKAGKLNATGAKISGDITMTGGSISWANINETGKSAAYELAEGASSAASNAQRRAESAYSYAGEANTNATAAKDNLTSLVSGSYTGGTFIDGRNIISANFYATNNISSGAYSTMKEDGFYIYRSTTDKPKMALTANSAGTAIGLRLGAGANDVDFPDEGKLTLEKYETYAKIYYMVNHNEYGFRFDSSGVTMLNGAFEVGTQSYAVFG